MARCVVMAAGGTGGHVIPAMRLAKEGDVLMGVGLENNPYLKEGIKTVSVSGGPLKRPLAIICGVFQSIVALRRIRPSLVVGFGSFHSLPPLIAAKLLRIPYLLYEPNEEMGRVNRLFAKGARGIGSVISFTECAREESGQLKLLAFGGSQGAVRLNRALTQIAGKLNLEITHLIGQNDDITAIQESYRVKKVKAHVKIFEQNMDLAYKSSHLVLARAGAGTISELIAYEMPAVLVPYPYAKGHQSKNAKLLEEIGGAIVIEEDRLTDESLLKAIEEVIDKRHQMREAIKDYKKSCDAPDMGALIETVLGET
ncbi:MAG: UDP-N-acetylglucosamine--N-acetylmuramyl-(pentapeptide) pyrophosphoryl-undecaprenol N-acetylglucosamine transferase [Simkaniaceae bacterium]|nr:UDP-N-acetylglucosamine--N-acetylmuramyl-(pentapeptide) pyrophosphoryl-undecaprenol N-acetylglucosamine transferase [Simkaniaceae bacterium]